MGPPYSAHIDGQTLLRARVRVATNSRALNHTSIDPSGSPVREPTCGERIKRRRTRRVEENSNERIVEFFSCPNLKEIFDKTSAPHLPPARNMARGREFHQQVCDLVIMKYIVQNKSARRIADDLKPTGPAHRTVERILERWKNGCKLTERRKKQRNDKALKGQSLNSFRRMILNDPIKFLDELQDGIVLLEGQRVNQPFLGKMANQPFLGNLKSENQSHSPNKSHHSRCGITGALLWTFVLVRSGRAVFMGTVSDTPEWLL